MILKNKRNATPGFQGTSVSLFYLNSILMFTKFSNRFLFSSKPLLSIKNRSTESSVIFKLRHAASSGIFFIVIPFYRAFIASVYKLCFFFRFQTVANRRKIDLVYNKR